MDTSETYIKMCDNDLLQSGASHRFENLPYTYHIEPNVVIDQYGHYWGRAEDERWIQLFIQDQLQEMVENKYDTWSYMARCFSEFASDEGWRSVPPDFMTIETVYNSMEQLWLAFVMKEKYNKEWDGEEWKN